MWRIRIFYRIRQGWKGGAIEYEYYQGDISCTGNVASALSTGLTATVRRRHRGEGTLPNDNSTSTSTTVFFRTTHFAEGGAIVFDSQRSSVKSSRFGQICACECRGHRNQHRRHHCKRSFSAAVTYFTKFTTTVSLCMFTSNIAKAISRSTDVMLGGLAAGLDFPLGEAPSSPT
jgi:hypothetical protein